MKNLVMAGLLLSLGGCVRNNSDNPPETPKALQKEQSVVSELKSYRGESLLEKLYEEIMSHDAALEQLDDAVLRMEKYGADSAEAFNSYYGKCRQYYREAQQAADGISDSSVKRQAYALLAAGDNRLQALVATDTLLLQQAAQRKQTLQDAYTVMKIVKTLPAIERFAAGNHPDSQPLVGLVKQYDQLISKVRQQK